jgi:hypothetical protein
MQSTMSKLAANHGDGQHSPIIESVSKQAWPDLSQVDPANSGHTHGYLTATLSAGATATGQHSVTEGSITNTVMETGDLVVAFGAAKAYAAATQSSSTPASQHAETSLSVSGADLVYEVQITETGHTGAVSWQASITQYVAIEFVGATHEAAANLHAFDFALLARLNLELDPNIAVPDGLLAEVDAHAQAFGPDGAAVTATHELSVEDHYSFVTGLSTVSL